MASVSKGYLSRSWALLTRDRGWTKAFLLLCVALFVPVVGLLFVSGYCLEWARLTAWGVDSAPKQKGIRVGACISSGFRAVMVSLIYGLLVGIAFSVLGSIPLLGKAASTLRAIVMIPMGTFILAANLRATIYEELGAGLGVRQLWEMVRRDTGGFLRIVGIQLLFGIVVGIVFGTMWTVAVVGEVFRSDAGKWIEILAMDKGDRYEYLMAASYLFEFFARWMPLVVVTSVGMAMALALERMLTSTACGLWFRQFDVGAWGRSSDPLPPEQPPYIALPPVSGDAYQAGQAYHPYPTVPESQGYPASNASYQDNYAATPQPQPTASTFQTAYPAPSQGQQVVAGPTGAAPSQSWPDGAYPHGASYGSVSQQTTPRPSHPHRRVSYPSTLATAAQEMQSSQTVQTFDLPQAQDPALVGNVIRHDPPFAQGQASISANVSTGYAPQVPQTEVPQEPKPATASGYGLPEATPQEEPQRGDGAYPDQLLEQMHVAAADPDPCDQQGDPVDEEGGFPDGFEAPASPASPEWPDSGSDEGSAAE